MMRTIMKTLYFQPVSKSPMRGWSDLAAEIQDEDGTVYWTVLGRMKGGYVMRKYDGVSEGRMVCFEEVTKRFFFIISMRLQGMNRRAIHRDGVIHSMNHRWGLDKGIMEFFLVDGVREYSNDHFTLVHKDFWSKLEIQTDGSRENIYLAAWWCFHYWFRKTRQG